MEENTAKTMIPDNTPYDKTFKGLLMDCRKLILPVLNEAFGEHYNGDEEIVFTQNEQIYPAEDGKRKRRFTDTSFMVTSHNNIIKRYHLEAESNTDNTILLRLFEYDIKYAFDQTRKITGRILEVSLPNTALLYLRSDPSTPDSMINRFSIPTGVFSYEIPVIKMKSYSLDEIFEKKLYFLLPFYIFNRENLFPEYEKDPVLRKQFLTEISDILSRLKDLEKNTCLQATKSVL